MERFVRLVNIRDMVLAVMVQILTGILSGGSIDKRGNEVKENVDATAYSFMVIDISKFTELEAFKKTVDIFRERLKKSLETGWSKRNLLPGEIEELKYKESEEQGIKIHEDVIKSLKQTVENLKMKFELDY